MDAAASFAAWIAALNRPRDRAALEAAVAPDARIERHDALDRGAPPPSPAEIFDGIDAIERWMHRLVRPVTFSLVGAPAAGPDDGSWTAEYALAVETFTGGGLWIARLAADGRLAYLSHRPFPLADQWLRP
ncbi:MAG TPA: hypothetical protein VHE35_20185 [Kofleriaceae bacterium]|nr:hypothetical protein [Kofleriaceae bacterium]